MLEQADVEILKLSRDCYSITIARPERLWFLEVCIIWQLNWEDDD